MNIYLVLGASGFIGTLGLKLLAKPFSLMASSSLRLLNTILDQDLEEEEKQKILIQHTWRTLAFLFLFLAIIVAVFFLAIAPFETFKYFLSPLEKLRASIEYRDNFYNYLSIGIGSAIALPFFIQWRKNRHNEWSILLHQLILDNYNVSKSLLKLEKKLYKKKTSSVNENFVIVTGLARTGTTALSNALYESKKFHSLTYANMPFLMAPNLWHKFYKGKKNTLQERAHGDHIKIGFGSIEALEEYFFKAFLKDSYISENNVTSHDIDNNIYQEYLSYQSIIRKEDNTTYLAKNNNFLLRYKSLRDKNKEFKVIMLFRKPLDHAHSLMKQHLSFSKQQEDDRFIREYMDWLGHHEFGLSHKPFKFQKSKINYRTDDINYWLERWIDYYSYALSLPYDKNLLLINYQDFLDSPEKTLAQIQDNIGINLSHIKPIHFKGSESTPAKANHQLQEKAKDIYSQLQQR